MSANANKHNLRRAMALLVILVSAGIFLAFPKPVTRSIAVLGFVAGASLARPPWVNLSRNAASRSLWAAALITLGATAAAFGALYVDAMDGYKAVMPVYLFAGAASVCIGVCAVLISKLL